MYLQRLEVQGFKTFAKKTVLEFPAPQAGSNPLTVVVGPNGSGKSNLSDAIRWCLGEQSMKQLRGKESQDIIFSGSEGRGRANFAEVTLTFNNEDKSMPSIEASEVTIARRLYRDGESSYMMQGAEVRLSDIQLTLAEAGVGQRSYAVIGQGMVDHILTSSPEERKIFFDDATGVRGLQIRRHQSMLKLERSAKNLADVELLLQELEPRLNLLKRQVKRLNEREKVEAELKEISANYFGTQFWNLQDEKLAIDTKVQLALQKVEAKKSELMAGDAKLAEMEKAEAGKVTDTSGVQEYQSAYKTAQEELAAARKAHFAIEREIELAKVRAQSSWAPLPLTDIIGEVKELASLHERLFAIVKTWGRVVDPSVREGEIQNVVQEIEAALGRSSKLRDRLIKPNPEDFKVDPKHKADLDNANGSIKAAEAKVKEAEQAMDAKAREASASKSEVFAFQRSLRQLQAEVMQLENERNAHSVELARVETRIESLMVESRDAIGEQRTEDMIRTAPETRAVNIHELHDKMVRVRHQLEMIGGIDPEVVKEHDEVNERFTFLSTQVFDLRGAIKATERVVDELDQEIRSQSERAFKSINEHFQKYFKVLFGGGSCSLVKMTQDDVSSENQVVLDRAMEQVAGEHNEQEESSERISERVANRKEAVAGIDIQATPPGKKLKALNLLSGGERALTSIALLSAIMETNPSPFVVLDEVDAALDEANTVRFANILNELRLHTQFIVITHNRATMEKADTLYGVTMGDEGISSLLSVRLEDIAGGDSARR
ncbi:MAG: AAA family ATPase [Patescibacteria group bacterium]